jgi:hypothetical protein
VTTNLTREQWILANALAGIVNACNAPFCVGEFEEREEINRDPHYIDNVASELSRLCSRMAIEDTLHLLETALGKCEA